MSVLIGIPCQDWLWTDSVAAIWQMERPAGAEFSLQTSPSPIAAKRNAIVRYFLERDFTHLLFCDSDMTPPRDALKRLAEHRAPVVSALCFTRKAPFVPCCGRVRDGKALHLERSAGQLQEVAWVGTGFLLLRRKVLEEMEGPWFVSNEDGYAEDLNFSLRLGQAGYKILVDTSLVVGHVGAQAVDHHLANAAGGLLRYFRGVR